MPLRSKVGNFIVQVGNAGSNINYKKNNGGFFNSDDHLFADSGLKNIFGIGYIATGIDYRKLNGAATRIHRNACRG